MTDGRGSSRAEASAARSPPRSLVEDLDALATRLSQDERAIVGRFLEEVAAVNERHAEDVARQAIEERDSPSAD